MYSLENSSEVLWKSFEFGGRHLTAWRGFILTIHNMIYNIIIIYIGKKKSEETKKMT